MTTGGFLMEVPGATKLLPTGQDVSEAYDVAPADIQLSTVNPDEGALNLILRTGPGSLEERAVVVHDHHDATPPARAATGEGVHPTAGTDG